MIDWIIYYEERGALKRFTSLDGKPWEAPRTGIQVIVLADEAVGRRLVYRADHYWWDFDRETWLGGDIAGRDDYLYNIPGNLKTCLLGRIIPDKEFQEYLRAAKTDPELPPKSARTQKEAELEDTVVKE